jgi:hypothetical protein
MKRTLPARHGKGRGAWLDVERCLHGRRSSVGGHSLALRHSARLLEKREPVLWLE